MYKASAPGSLMLLGEHAVLDGFPAIVCAIDKRITVCVMPQTTNEIVLQSDRLGQLRCAKDDIKPQKPFQFVLAVLKKFAAQLPSGCHIEITSAFSDKIGFASSAAVTVALAKAILTWLNQPTSDDELHHLCHQIILSVQGVGSGADVAAAILGGMVSYQYQTVANMQKFTHVHPIQVVYSGYKTPTPEVIHIVNQRFTQEQALLAKIKSAIGECAAQGIQALGKSDWVQFGRLMTIQQSLMTALGVNNHLLQTLVQQLENEETILGAKISGSGLGDCVVGLGHSRHLFFDDTQISIVPVEMSLDGVAIEKS